MKFELKDICFFDCETTGYRMGIAARPGKGNRQPDGKLGRIGTGRIRRR